MTGLQLLNAKLTEEMPGREFATFNNSSAERERITNSEVFRHSTCVATVSEEEAYNEASAGYTTVEWQAHTPPRPRSPNPVWRYKDTLRYHITPNRTRHVDCGAWATNRQWLRGRQGGHSDLDLNILGASRQIYEEANNILWATNTFSFNDPVTFGKFMASLNTAQKKKLKNLHLSSIFYEECVPETVWDQTITKRLVRVLHGLRTLHLCIEIRATRSLFCHSKPREEFVWTDLDDLFRPFLLFRMLPLTKATVMVSDSIPYFDHLNDDDEIPTLFTGDGTHYRLTATEKRGLAEVLRGKILDPQTAENFEEEEKAMRAKSFKISSD